MLQMVADMLFAIWDLEVMRPCVDGGRPWCDGACLANIVRVLGICMTVGAPAGINSTHPFALQPDWSLRNGKPLITPGRAAPEYVSHIFTGKPDKCIALAKQLVCPGFVCLGVGTSGAGQPLPPYDSDARAAQIVALCVLRVPLECGQHYARGVRNGTPSAMYSACGSHAAYALASSKCPVVGDRIQWHRHSR